MTFPAQLLARTVAALVAALCGLGLILILSLLGLGHLIRSFGSVVVNGCTLAQLALVRIMQWTDKKLFPAGISPSSTKTS